MVRRGDSVTLAGTIDSARRRFMETGFAILRLKVDNEYTQYPFVHPNTKLCTIVGDLAQVGVGQRVTITGTYSQHATYGEQIHVTALSFSEPKTHTDLQKYLSNEVPLIGKKLSRQIVEHLGDQTIAVLDTDPDRLREIEGIGEKRLEQIKQIWAERREFRSLVMFCSSIGLSTTYLNRIVKKYKSAERAIAIIREDPYKLARDVWGIGFQKADEVARHLGIEELSYVRVRAMLIHILDQASESDGHCFMYEPELLTKCVQFVENRPIDPTYVKQVLDHAIHEKLMVRDENRVYTPDMYEAEVYVARRLREILNHPLPDALQGEKLNHAFLTAEAATNVPLSDLQRQGIYAALATKVFGLTGGPGTGKCLGRGTPVLMFDGSIKKVEDVVVGDLLMGPDSKPRRVLSLARGREMLYRVTPTKGDSYVVNESHILSLQVSGTQRGRRLKDGEIVNISVRDYLASSAKFRHRTKGWRAAVNFMPQPQHRGAAGIDPYFLGVWLGDGSSDGVKVHSETPEVIAYLHELAETHGLQVTEHAGNRCRSWSITTGVRGGGPTRTGANAILTMLQDHNLLNNKHIPHCFKTGTRECRLRVLAGLIDTDGELTYGCYSITQKSERLADDICFVARSLGFAAYKSPCTKSSQNDTEGTYYRVTISGSVDLIPVRVASKVAALRRSKKNVLRTGIEVSPIGEGDYFGFEISGDRLFMLGDFTVTHNTTITKGIVEGFEQAGIPVTLMAPTGAAAKRMKRVIKRNAQTAHKWLFATELAVKKNPDLDPESLMLRGVVIVDEWSMADIKLMAWLLRWVHPSASLVVIGDKDQLPSVGPGAVLRDIMMSQSIPCIHLTQIFRQAAESNIIVNAHRINQGHMPMLSPVQAGHPIPSTDMVTWCLTSNESMLNATLFACTTLAQSYGLNPAKDVQILTPRHTGELGVAALNGILQRAINPQPPMWVDRGQGVVWAVGDRVLQRRNNYNLGVFNGDQGIIRNIEVDDNKQLRKLLVEFDDDQQVEYEGYDEWGDLSLAYATTIHKSQGSEWPMVIVLIAREHGILLQRNLLYTAITRGRQKVVLIYDSDALSRAVNSNSVARRNTFLAERIRLFREV